MSQIRFGFSLALIVLLAARIAAAAEIEVAEHGIVVAAPDDWSVADAEITKQLTQATTPGAVAHARAKGVEATAQTVDSAILLVISKLPLGSPDDNPNLVLAKEKAWTDEFAETGAGYLQLMQDRIKLLNAPTKFVGEPIVFKVKDVEFHQQDAVNSHLPAAKTTQRYICAFKDGYYVYFVLSFNDDNDADYATMIKVVESFESAEE